MSEQMIRLQSIKKSYDLGATQVHALRGIDLTIKSGEFVTIMGPSGSGKSTLLHVLGILDTPTSGSYFLQDHDITGLSDAQLSRVRNRNFGFVFQSFNLFSEMNAIENVMVPLSYAKVPVKERKQRAQALLVDVGLGHRLYHYPSMMSGGEQQRVAIARALANNPTLILADEPTGNLPSDKGEEIMAILDRLNQNGVTIIMVTHDDELGRRGSRCIRIHDGEIAGDEPTGHRVPEVGRVDA